MTNVQGRNT